MILKVLRKLPQEGQIEVFYLQHVKVDTPNLFVIVCAPILILVILVVGTMPECKIKLWRKNWIHMNKYRYLLILHFPSFVIVYYNNFLLSLENLLARRKQHTCCILLKSCIISLCKQQEFIQNFSRHLLRIL